MILLLLLLSGVLTSRSCFFCSRSSESSQSPVSINKFTSSTLDETGSLLAQDGSSLERAQHDSTSLNSYESLAFYTPVGNILTKANIKRRRERNENPMDIFESFDTLSQMEEDYPLCKQFDEQLIHSRSGRYIPAIRWSRVLGGPAQKCHRRDFGVGSLIGKGAFGKVVRATHKRTGKTMALKYIKYDENELHSLSEIRQEECLQHRMEDFKPVARHYCSFDMVKGQENYVVLVLEHIEGNELFNVIYGRAPSWPSYDEDNMLTWTAQLIIILRELHARNVVIMDLKPENLILEPNGNLRLIDFGLAGDPTRPSKYCYGRNIGTPMYNPPEFIHDEDGYSDDIDSTDRHQLGVDWYCLGMTLYEILYRKEAFDTTDEYELQRQIKHDGVGLKRPSTIRGIQMADLIGGFTWRDPKKRLGVHEATDEYLDQHPFFRGIRIDTFRILYRHQRAKIIMP